MSVVSPPERKLSSSLTLNPQNKKGSPLSAITDQIYEQAQQVKYHLRNKSSSRTNSQQHNAHHLNPNNEKYEQILANNSKNKRNKVHLGESKKFELQKNEVKKYSNTQKSQKNQLKWQDLLQDKNKKLFSKITIHYLRNERQKIDEEKSKIQNFYLYTINKIEKLKKNQEKKVKQAKKLEIIKKQKRRSVREITQAKLFHEEEHHKRSLQLKSQVYNHRLNKQIVLQKAWQKKQQAGATCRIHSQSLSQLMEQQNSSRIRQKQMLFMRQKVQELKHRKQVQRLKDEKRKEAKHRYKKKWVEQYNSIQKSRQEMMANRQQLSYKIRQALNSYSRNLTEI